MRARLLLVIVALITASSAEAYEQWQWKVSGWSEIFTTKSGAVSFMRGLSDKHAYLTIEMTADSPTDDAWAYYKYVAPKVGPIPTSNFRYFDGVHPVSEGATTSEEAFAAAVEAYLAEFYQGSQCPMPTFTPNGTWEVVSDYWGVSTRERKKYRERAWSWNGIECITNSDFDRYVYRDRSANCPYPYSGDTVAPGCLINTSASIQGRPLLACPETDPVPDAVGNPCHARTGDKSQSETDYSGAGLRFERNYHSITEDSRGALGVGWSHNFGASLIVRNAPGIGLNTRDGMHDTFEGIAADHYLSRAGTGLQLKRIGAEWVLYRSSGDQEVYDATGRLVRLQEHGRTTTLVYTDNRLTEIVGPFGHKLQLQYDGQLLKRVVDPAGQSITYSYDGLGNLVQASYPNGTFRVYHYENPSFPNNLTGITDEAAQRFATFGYDSVGRAALTEHAGSVSRYTLEYSPTATTVTDPLGTTRVFEFTNDSLSRRLKSYSYGDRIHLFFVPSWSVDSQRRITQSTDARGAITKFVYDRDHLVSKTEAFGTPRARTKTYSYQSTDNDLPAQVVESSRVTNNAYDANGNLLTREVSDSSTLASRRWVYSYNQHGRVLIEDGPRTDVSDITTYTYYTCSTGYECGQLHTATNALGQTTTYNTYNAHGQPLTITDPNGVVSTLTYDLRQRLTSRSVGSETTSFEYWPTGLLKKVTLPDSSFVLYTYDAAHRLIKVEDGQGHRIEYTLDAMGNRTAENAYDPSGALSRTRTQVFNALNQLWKQVGAAGTSAVTTVFGYDNNGNQTTIAAPLGRNTLNAYDELNRLKQITDPANGVTQFSYDAHDHLTSVQDPRNLLTSYVYDGFGDLKQQTSPDTGVTTHAYDSAGNLRTRTDARNKTGTYSYDALNRVTSISYPDQTTSFTYDSGTNGIGRLTGASDANHALAWTYDAQGRVIGKGQTVGAITKSMGYGYTNGNLTSLVTPSGQAITYGYANGRITSLTVNGTTLLSNVLYEPFGPVAGWTWGNGTQAVRVHDTDGKPTQIDSVGAHTYSYDDAFRITSLTDLSDPTKSWNYGYDLMDRLNSATSTGQSIGYTYDANGNRLTQTGTQSATYAIATNSNRLTSVSGTPTRTYTYDAAGSTTGYAGLSFTYSDAGRLISTTNSGVTTNYVINALGQRVKKASSAATHYFMYDEASHLIGEYDASGALVQETIWLNDTPVATLRPNGSAVSVYYIHTDHLDTPRRISRPSDNAVVWRWDSDPFGSISANEDLDGDAVPFVSHLRFPGQYFDSESGLIYNYQRDYDPQIGRYVQSDPIGLQGGLNTYAYVNGNPISFVDPFGLKTTVTVRCGSLPASMGGSSGGVHCEVVAYCDLTGERVAFGIGGGGDGIWERLFGGKEPPKYRNRNQPPIPPTGISEASASCGSEADCSCQIMTCLQRGFLQHTPPPYYALTRNSNSYAHFILNQCGCSLNERPSGAVAW